MSTPDILRGLTGQSGPMTKPMNVSEQERWLSVVGGAALAVAGFKLLHLRGLVLLGLGALLVRRGATGHCDVYEAAGIDTAGAHRNAGAPDDERLDDESSDSFPASDAPSWTPTSSLGGPR